MCYATTVCSTRVVRVGLCVRSFGRGFLPMYESREVSTKIKIIMQAQSILSISFVAIYLLLTILKSTQVKLQVTNRASFLLERIKITRQRHYQPNHTYMKVRSARDNAPLIYKNSQWTNKSTIQPGTNEMSEESGSTKKKASKVT